jgi:hypothetical protein
MIEKKEPEKARALRNTAKRPLVPNAPIVPVVPIVQPLRSVQVVSV